jgi:hypothetical protein
MVKKFIEPNFQDIIFTLSTVGLITQKCFSVSYHLNLKNLIT